MEDQERVVILCRPLEDMKVYGKADGCRCEELEVGELVGKYGRPIMEVTNENNE